MPTSSRQRSRSGRSMQVRLSVDQPLARVVPPLPRACPVVDQWRARGADHDGSPRRHWAARSVSSMSVLPGPGPGRTESTLLDVPTGRRGGSSYLPSAPGPTTRSVSWEPRGRPRPSCSPRSTLPRFVWTRRLPPARRRSPERSRTVARPREAGRVISRASGPTWPATVSSSSTWPAMARYGTWLCASSAPRAVPRDSSCSTIGSGSIGGAEFERLISAALGAVDEMTGEHRAVRLMTLAGRSYSFEPTHQGRSVARLVLAESLRPTGARNAIRTSFRFRPTPCCSRPGPERNA